MANHTQLAQSLMNEETEDNFDPEEPPKDLFFNPWRIPVSERSKAIVDEAVRMLENYEKHFKLRRRKRKPRDQDIFEETVSAVLCDVMHQHLLNEQGGLAITRSNSVLGRKSRYRPRAYNKTLPDILDRMNKPEMAFVTQEIGYEGHFGRGQQTVIAAGERTKERIKDHGIELSDFSVSDRREVIVLRRAKSGFWDDGGDLEYDDTPDTIMYRKEVEEINRWLLASDIDYAESFSPEADTNPVDINDLCLRRIFTQNSFECGGRLFGGFWQNLSKNRRLDAIFLDGEQIIELDFGQMTARIFYGFSRVGPHSGDLYEIPGLEKNRKGVKKVLNAMAFSNERLSRMPKGARALFPDGDTIKDVMDRIEHHHSSIAEHFFKGAGHRAQLVESNILIDILKDLKEQGITALPIHDAILVPRSKEKQACQVMKSAFRKHTGVEALVTVERRKQ